MNASLEVENIDSDSSSCYTSNDDGETSTNNPLARYQEEPSNKQVDEIPSRNPCVAVPEHPKSVTSNKVQSDFLAKKAMEELTKEAKIGAIKEADFGACAWASCPKTNKTFLTNTLVSTLRDPIRKDKKRREWKNSNEDDGGAKSKRSKKNENEEDDDKYEQYFEYFDEHMNYFIYGNSYFRGPGHFFDRGRPFFRRPWFRRGRGFGRGWNMGPNDVRKYDEDGSPKDEENFDSEFDAYAYQVDSDGKVIKVETDKQKEKTPDCQKNAATVDSNKATDETKIPKLKKKSKEDTNDKSESKTQIIPETEDNVENTPPVYEDIKSDESEDEIVNAADSIDIFGESCKDIDDGEPELNSYVHIINREEPESKDEPTIRCPSPMYKNGVKISHTVIPDDEVTTYDQTDYFWLKHLAHPNRPGRRPYFRRGRRPYWHPNMYLKNFNNVPRSSIRCEGGILYRNGMYFVPRDSDSESDSDTEKKRKHRNKKEKEKTPVEDKIDAMDFDDFDSYFNAIKEAKKKEKNKLKKRKKKKKGKRKESKSTSSDDSDVDRQRYKHKHSKKKKKRANSTDSRSDSESIKYESQSEEEVDSRSEGEVRSNDELKHDSASNTSRSRDASRKRSVKRKKKHKRHSRHRDRSHSRTSDSEKSQSDKSSYSDAKYDSDESQSSRSRSRSSSRRRSRSTDSTSNSSDSSQHKRSSRKTKRRKRKSHKRKRSKYSH